MNIILINHYAGSPRHGMEFRPYYLASKWVKLGHSVTIVGASVSHVRTQSLVFEGAIYQEEIDGIRYLWLKTPPYYGNGIGRVINIFSFVKKLLQHQNQIIANHQTAAVIASSTYPLDILPAYCIAVRTGARLIYEVHDLWPLSLIELGHMSPWHPFIALLQWAENFAYRHADYVVSMLPKAQTHMQQHGMVASKFVHIPNGIDITEWQHNTVLLPEQHRDVLLTLKKQGFFIVGYTGAHGLANALDNLLGAAERLEGQPVSIVLVGQGPEKIQLQARVQERGLSQVIFLPSVPKAAIPELLGLMDALYIGLKNEPLFRFGISPNKLLDYMMAAKPVIQAINAGNDLVAESGCGISVPPDDADSLAEAIMRLRCMTDAERQTLGLNGRKYVLDHHDYRVLAQQFLSVMTENPCE
jgi:glycosyltransferase involved in cell wall biosynthesis